MSFRERVVAGLRTMILLDKRLTALSQTVKDHKFYAEQKLASHESRLTRLETIIERTRPDGTTLRLSLP